MPSRQPGSLVVYMTDSIVDDVERYPEHWESRWSEGRTGWDQAQAHPALVSFLESAVGKELIPRNGRALIPGCGLGYDVDLFSRHGFDSTGLDISPTGAKLAARWLANQPPRAAAANAVEADFFQFSPKEKYDLIYDYTFLCALPRSLRSDWADKIAALSYPSRNSRLVTLMFPLNGGSGGPPFSLTETEYESLLGTHWEIVWSKVISHAQKRVNSPPGGEKLVVWRRKYN